MTSGSVASGSIASSATVDNAGALDGVGRADEILRAEVDDVGVELATGTVLEDGCVDPHSGASSKSLHSGKSRDAHRDTKTEAMTTLPEMEPTTSDGYGMAT